jgi:hypothetical protein
MDSRDLDGGCLLLSSFPAKLVEATRRFIAFAVDQRGAPARGPDHPFQVIRRSPLVAAANDSRPASQLGGAKLHRPRDSPKAICRATGALREVHASGVRWCTGPASDSRIFSFCQQCVRLFSFVSSLVYVPLPPACDRVALTAPARKLCFPPSLSPLSLSACRASKNMRVNETTALVGDKVVLVPYRQVLAVPLP